jgi:hypothetical protein
MNVRELKSILKLLPDNMLIKMDISEFGYYINLTRVSKVIVYNPTCTSDVTSLYTKELLLISEKKSQK